VASEDHFEHLAVQFGKVAVGPLEKRFSPWVGFNNGQTAYQMRGLVVGLRHGLYCLGCCWVLMALLLVAGVMNLLWVAAIAVAVLVEKVVPRGDLVGRLAGVVLAAAGVLLAARGVIG